MNATLLTVVVFAVSFYACLVCVSCLIAGKRADETVQRKVWKKHELN